MEPPVSDSDSQGAMYCASGAPNCTPYSWTEFLVTTIIVTYLLMKAFRGLSLGQIKSAHIVAKADETAAGQSTVLSHEGAKNNSKPPKGQRKSEEPLGEEAVNATLVWSGLVLLMFVYVTVSGASISPPYALLVTSLAVSGVLIQFPLAQAVFHVCTTCSWFTVIDTYVIFRDEIELRSLLFSAKSLLAFMVSTSVVVRTIHGHFWQLSDTSYRVIGILLILFYYWTLDLPSCSIFLSSVMCDLFGRSSNQFLHDSWSNRTTRITLMTICHYFLSVMMMGNIGDEFQIEKKNSDDDVIHKVNISDCSPNEGTLFNKASSKKNTKNKSDFVDEESSFERGKLPPDCVEISEAEAIEIIQCGLNNCKSRRAD